MRTSAELPTPAPTAPNPSGRRRSFAELRWQYDARVLAAYYDRNLRRAVEVQAKTHLGTLWHYVVRKLDEDFVESPVTPDPLDIHKRIVEGLPGEAMFVSSAMVFDSMSEALALFDVSSKTARLRIGNRLSTGESEIALRIGRVLVMARDVFGTLDAAREYLRVPNFALGGAVPRDLLKTAEGELMVLSELGTQAEGGPV